MVDLDGTVEEVKDNIRNASNPDYEELLKKEEEGKNRKTIIEFLEKKIGEEVEEDMNKSEEEQVEDELVEEIEEGNRRRTTRIIHTASIGDRRNPNRPSSRSYCRCLSDACSRYK